jgi:hypothetical protein
MYLRYLQTPRLLISTIHVKLSMFAKSVTLGLQNTEITLIYKIKLIRYDPNGVPCFLFLNSATCICSVCMPYTYLTFIDSKVLFTSQTYITLIYKIFWKFDTFTPNVFYLYNHLKPMYEFKIRWHRYFDVPLYMIAAVTKNRHYVRWTCTKLNVMHQIGFPVFNYSRCTTTNSLKTVSENSTLKFK